MSDEEVNEYEQVVQVEEAQAIARIEGFCREKKKRVILESLIHEMNEGYEDFNRGMKVSHSLVVDR